MAFVAGGGQLLSGGWDGRLKLWDAATGRELASWGPGAQAHGITSLALSTDGQRVLSAGFDSVVRLWDLGTRAELRTWRGHADTVWAVAFGRDGRTAFSGSFDGSLRVWSAGADASVAAWTEPAPEERGWKRALLLSPDGEQLLVGGAVSPRAWSRASGRQLAPFGGGHQDSVLALALTAEGRRLVSGGFDGELQLWDLQSRASLARWHAGQGEAVWALATLPDGRLVSAGASGTLRVWTLER